MVLILVLIQKKCVLDASTFIFYKIQLLILNFLNNLLIGWSKTIGSSMIQSITFAEFIQDHKPTFWDDLGVPLGVAFFLDFGVTGSLSSVSSALNKNTNLTNSTFGKVTCTSQTILLLN